MREIYFYKKNLLQNRMASVVGGTSILLIRTLKNQMHVWEMHMPWPFDAMYTSYEL